MANRAPANWAPADWAPEILLVANRAPANWAPADWAPANRAPADWAPWWQIGPLGGKLGPWKFCCGKSVPGKSGPGKLGPGKLGPWIIWIRQIVFIEYKYIHIGEVCQLVLDKFCQQLGNTYLLNSYIGIGYILLTIGEYM